MSYARLHLGEKKKEGNRRPDHRVRPVQGGLAFNDASTERKGPSRVQLTGLYQGGKEKEKHLSAVAIYVRRDES